MRDLRGTLGAILLGILSFIIVIGGVALTLAESNLIPADVVETLPPGPSETPVPALTPAQSDQDTPTLTLIASPTPVPTTTTCPPPAGWLPIFVQPGESIDSLARDYKISPDLLAQQNCLILGAALPQGAVIYVPQVASTPRPTAAPTRCGPPATWIPYTVKAGDNLYRIGLAYGVTVTQLKLANCLNSDNITVGQKIFVPNVPTRTPTNTPSQAVTVTPTATITLTPESASPTPTTPAPPTATDTATQPPTAPPTETPTETNTPGS